MPLSQINCRMWDAYLATKTGNGEKEETLPAEQYWPTSPRGGRPWTHKKRTHTRHLTRALQGGLISAPLRFFRSSGKTAARRSDLTFKNVCVRAKATVFFRKFWNLQDFIRISVHTIYQSRIFCIGDQRSGQFPYLPIISEWENKQMLPFQKICIESG